MRIDARLVAGLVLLVACRPSPAPGDGEAEARGPGAGMALMDSTLEVDPTEVGMSTEGLERLDSIVLAEVEGGAAPGASLAVARHGRLVRLRGYGWLDTDHQEQVTPRTLYDLASLTKVVGTTTAIFMLEREGKLSLDDRVVEHLPGWDRGDPAKATVTLRQLLLHRAGLAAFHTWFTELEGKEAYRAALYDEPLQNPPGSHTEYSDLGAMTLGFVVEAVSGQSLDAFLEARVFGPLGMEDTGFLPDKALLPRIAPTEVDTVWRMRHVHGTVHDENADAMGGVAGHAGLFSTAFDLAVFADMMLRGGAAPACRPEARSGVPCPRARSEPFRLLDSTRLARYTRRYDSASSRAIGWDTPEGRSSAGDYLSARSFGHTGFTGTSIWIDPELDLYVVLLTNRVNPTRENMGHIELRRAVHNQVARSITDRVISKREGAP